MRFTQGTGQALWLGTQQRQQAALAIKCYQVITAAHMGVSNENLRHSAAICQRHHLFAFARYLVYANFDEFSHAAFGKQLLGSNAVRACACGVNFDGMNIKSLLSLQAGWPLSRL